MIYGYVEKSENTMVYNGQKLFKQLAGHNCILKFFFVFLTHGDNIQESEVYQESKGIRQWPIN